MHRLTLLFLAMAAGARFAAADPAAALCTWSNGSITRLEVRRLGSDGLAAINPSNGRLQDYPLSQVQFLYFLPTPEWEKAGQSIADGNPAEAAKLMQPLAENLLTYLQFPHTNAADYVVAYADLLRATGQTSQASLLLASFPPSLPAEQSELAGAMEIGLLTQSGQLASARDALAKLARERPQPPAATPFRALAEARLQLEEGAPLQALHTLAPILLHPQAGQPSTPEALALACLAYHRLDPIRFPTSRTASQNLARQLIATYPSSPWRLVLPRAPQG